MKLTNIFFIFSFCQFIFTQNLFQIEPELNSFLTEQDSLRNVKENKSSNQIGNFKNYKNKKIIYLSPVPNSKLNLPKTNIIIRTNVDLDEATLSLSGLLSVVGSFSGEHSGKVVLSDDSRTIIFQPDMPFNYNESVNVRLNNGLLDKTGNQIDGISFNFDIATANVKKNIQTNEQPKNNLTNSKETGKDLNNIVLLDKDLNNTQVQDFSNLPDDFPKYNIQQSDSSNGFLFISDISFLIYNNPPYFLMIIDNQGKPFYYKRLNLRGYDFKLQPNGMMSWCDFECECFLVMDSTFTVVYSIYAQNGLLTNEHELRILPNEHALLIGLDIESYDMSKIIPEGDTNASIVIDYIQELDKDKNVVFQWRSMDYFDFRDATWDIDLTADFIDNVHINSLELDNDGNIILSSRNMSEITKIDRQTGDIIWRWGGKNNQFKFINDSVGFSHQHSVRRIDNGNITLFDNGNLHFNLLPSRAVEYKLDEENKTAELVWQNINDSAIYSLALGYVQRLSNGNTLIAWGVGDPAVTEVDSSNQKVFELRLPLYTLTYRAYRFDLSKAYYSSFVPKLIEPPNLSKINTDTVRMIWLKNKLANRFHIQVAKDSNFTKLILDDSTLTENSITFNLLEPNTTYYWHVLSYNNDKNVGGYSGSSEIWNFTIDSITNVNEIDSPGYNVSQNYPNPFANSTIIKYKIPDITIVSISICNELGIEISRPVNTLHEAGSYEFKFNSGELPAGIYYYTFKAGTFSQTLSMFIIR